MRSEVPRTRARSVCCLGVVVLLGTAPCVALELPEPLARALKGYIAAQYKAGRAPNWKAPAIGEVVSLNGLLRDAAYFEVGIDSPSGPAGYVVMSATQDDFPIVQWSDRHERPSKHLLSTIEGDAGVVTIYRVGVHYIAVDARRTIRGSIPGLTLPAGTSWGGEREGRGEGPDAPASWASIAALAKAPVARSLSQQREAVKLAWNALGSPWPVPGAVCEVEDAYASPNYRQLRPNEAPNQNWFSSGCGPTAWMMLLGWADRRAHAGDATWAPHWQLFLDGGAWGPFGPDGIAAATLGPAEGAVTMNLHDRFGTWGVPHSREGSTEPWRMDRMKDHLDAVGIRHDVVAADTETAGGAQAGGYRESAARSICMGYPVVVGVGALEHYALATATSDTSGKGLVYLNMGWAGAGNGWYSDGFFFVGHLVPKKFATLPPGALVSAASGQCLDVRGNTSQSKTPVQQWGCTPSPNQRWQWLPTGEILGIERTCLDVRDASSAPGAPVQIYECTGHEAQRWRPSSLRLVASTGSCLRSTQAAIAAGGKALAFARCDGPDSAWTLRSSGQLVNQQGLCLESNAGGRLGVGDCGNDRPPGGVQSWAVTAKSQIRSLNAAFQGQPGQCLAGYRANIGAEIPARIVSEPCDAKPAQVWQVEASFVGHGSQCLALGGNPGAMGTPVVMQLCSGGADQRWRLVPGH